MFVSNQLKHNERTDQADLRRNLDPFQSDLLERVNKVLIVLIKLFCFGVTKELNCLMGMLNSYFLSLNRVGGLFRTTRELKRNNSL